MTNPSGPNWPTVDRDAQQPVQGTPQQPPSEIDQNVQMQAVVNRVDHIAGSAFGRSPSDGPAISTSDTGGSGAGSYYKLDPDQVRGYYGRLKKLEDRAQSLHYRLQNLHDKAYSPANNNPSLSQTKASIATIQAAIKHLGGIIKYTSDYHDKMVRSVHDYEKVEDTNAGDVKKAGDNAHSGRAV